MESIPTFLIRQKSSIRGIKKNNLWNTWYGSDEIFPQFIMELPEVLENYPEIVVEIAGNDEAAYGRDKPKNGKYRSWGSWAKRYLKTKKIDDRVKWIGYLNQDAYIDWLQSSDCHIYLTHPFVASWSLVEAFCCGLPIITSDIQATHEICRDDPLTVYETIGTEAS